MNYRTAPPRRDRIEVVRHRPMHPAALAVILAVFAAMLIVVGAVALEGARSVELECTRGGVHTCDVRRSYGPITTHESVPIGSIRAVLVTSHSNKGRITWGVELATNDRAVKLLRPSTRELAESIRSRAIAMIRAEQPGTETLFVQEGRPLQTLTFVLPGVFIVIVLLSLLRTARLDLHLDRGTIVLTRTRWPLSPVQRTLRLDEVDRARLDARPGSKGSTLYEVRLVLRDGEEIALVPHASGSESRVAQTVTEINQHLHAMRALRV